MNFHWPQIFHRTPAPSHVVVKHFAATKAENKAAQRKRDETTAALRRVVTEQRLADAVIEQRVHDAMAFALGLDTDGQP